MLLSTLWAQAEAAPDPGPAPELAPSASLPRVHNELPVAPPPIFAEAAVRLSIRLPPASNNAGPPLGVGFGFMLGSRYALIAHRLELALALDFGYAHHNKGVQGERTLPNGLTETFDGQQVISENTFGVLHLFNFVFAQARPWVGFGGGLGVGYFESDTPAFRPGATRSYRPYGQIAGGVSVPITEPLYVDLRVDYHLMLTEPVFTPESGEAQQVLGDLVTVGVAFGSRFP